MVQPTSIMVDTMLRLLPVILIIYACLKGNITISVKSRIFIIVFLCISCIGTLIPLYIFFNGFGSWLTYYRIFFPVFCLVFVYFFIQLSSFWLLLVYFIVQNFMDIVSLIKETMMYYTIELGNIHYYEIGLVENAIILILLLPLMVRFIVPYLRKIIEYESTEGKWKYLWLVPFSFSLMFWIAIEPYFFMRKSTVSNILLIMIIWTVGICMVYVAIYHSLSETRQNAELQKKLALAEMQSILQKRQQERLLSTMEDVRRNRHDLRHHLLALRSYSENKDFNKINDYIDNYIHRVFKDDDIRLCDNALIDSILHYYKSLCNENHVKFTINTKIPRKIAVEDSDLCVILGNTVENALEACMRQVDSEHRFIEVKAEMFGNQQFVLIVKNSYTGDIYRNSKGDYISSKRTQVGIGVSSVKEMCIRYHGVSKFEYKDGIFEVSIMLQQKDYEKS
ncbi:MAG: GHKL domain-containing protein [Erysipelotrichaceae bacterium]